MVEVKKRVVFELFKFALSGNTPPSSFHLAVIGVGERTPHPGSVEGMLIGEKRCLRGDSGLKFGKEPL